MIFPSSGILTRSEGGVTQVSTLPYSGGWEDGAISDGGRGMQQNVSSL